MYNSLNEKLREYALKNPLRMHMPGHKGAADSCTENARFDITEINGFDNLHNPEGVIKESQELAAKVWGSKKSFYLVNGSTCGILAGIRALTNCGDRVIVARNCHKSVYHALELCGLKSVFVMPSVVEKWNLFGSVNPQDVEKALENNPGASLVIVTSPTYEGVISDIKQICRIAHSKGVRVLVDEAHGAHLALDDYFEKDSIKYADIVVQSLHKTLDCPTQSAIMHIGDSVDEHLLRHQLSVFETSSPSYILMSGIDSFVRKAADEKGLLRRWTEALEEFYRETRRLKNIEILAHEADDIPHIFAYDKSKIVFRCKNVLQLTENLRKKHNTEIEAANTDFAIAMTGAGDSSITLGKFSDILISEDCCAKRADVPYRQFIYKESTIVRSAQEVLSGKLTLVGTGECAGRICGEYIWEYPPGIPVLIPGEVIPQSFIETAKNNGSTLCSQSGALPEKILVSYENI